MDQIGPAQLGYLPVKLRLEHPLVVHLLVAYVAERGRQQAVDDQIVGVAQVHVAAVGVFGAHAGEQRVQCVLVAVLRDERPFDLFIR